MFRCAKPVLDTYLGLCYSTPRLCGCSASGRIAQLVEQLTLNQRVQGSSPCAPTTSLPKRLPERHHGELYPVRGLCHAHLRGVARDRNELVLSDPDQSRKL